jgi:hypothetical protein
LLVAEFSRLRSLATSFPQLHPNLQPAEYAIAHTIFYDDGMAGFSSTFFNQTVELYTPEEGVGVGDTLRLVFFLASTVFVGGLFYFLVFKEELPTFKKSATQTTHVRFLRCMCRRDVRGSDCSCSRCSLGGIHSHCVFA